MNPEKKIELEIKKELERTGWFVFKISQPSTYARNIKGISDLYAIRNGLNVWIEVKAKSPQSDAQKLFQAKIEANGGHYRLVNCINDINKLNNSIIAYVP